MDLLSMMVIITSFPGAASAGAKLSKDSGDFSIM